MTSATLLSSTSPHVKRSSAERSRIQPGSIRVPYPVSRCCDEEGGTRILMSEAVDVRSCIIATACIPSPSPLRRSSMDEFRAGADTMENSEESCCEDMLSLPAKEKSESLDGMSMSEDKSGAGVESLSVGSDSPGASLTKQRRVLISSMTESVSTSGETRDLRLVRGTEALRLDGGERYEPYTSMKSRR